MTDRRRSAARALRATLAAALGAALLFGAPHLAAAQAADSTFAGLVARLSEPGGYFDSDNIITNELSYLHVASQLEKAHAHGGVYLGVGPDQNFSYIALIKPSVAIVVDVRRDNMLEHLLFKSLFLLARNRMEYLCLLLGKAPPSDVAAWSTRPVGDLIAYAQTAPVDSAVVTSTREASNERINGFHLPLDARDRSVIDRYRAQFVREGLDTRYSSLGRNNRGDYPSLATLAAATDRSGKAIGYLADETAFQYVRRMQASDRIIPVVGNIAGDQAMAAIARYAGERHLIVSAFYVSNVEQYLLGRDGGFDAYARNVKRLPRDSTSVIIRSYFGGRFGASQHPLYVPAPQNISTSLVERMDSFVRAFDAGEIRGYASLVSSRYIVP